MKTYKDAIVIYLSDMQIGSTMAMAPRRWSLSDGGMYTPSPVQKVIRKYYEQGVSAITELRKDKRVILVLNGEPIDGVHHETAQLISQLADEQIEMATTIIDELLLEIDFNKEKGDQFYFIEGTEAHDGKQHQNIERVARDFEELVTPYRPDKYGKDGRLVHPYLKLIINNKRIRIQHHGAGVGSRFHTRENSLNNYIKSIFHNCVAYGEEPPDWLIQSHYHRYVRATYRGIWNGKRKKIEGVITPALQVATSFVKKISPADLSDLGIYFHIIDSNGNVEEHEETIFRAPDEKYRTA